MLRRLKAPSLSGLGLQRLWSDLTVRRYRHRQFVTIVYVVLLSVLGVPERFPALFWPGAILVIVGEAVRVWASGHVKKDKCLATTGPYAFVRHPLYVGNNTIVVGFCLASGLWWGLPLWVALAVAFFPPAISHEDMLLHRLFGSEWEDWRMHTRALIPRLTPFRLGIRGEWSLRQSLRINGEPLIAVFLGGCLYVLHLKLT